MKTIAIYNFKGGAFKTTATHHIAAGLAVKGHKVLVLDTDPQGHATLLFGIKPDTMLHDFLARSEKMTFQEASVVIPRDNYFPDGVARGNGNVVIIPGNEETSFVPLKVRDPLILYKRLKQVMSIFDFCIIDTPPTPSLLSVITYAAIDAVLYPTMCEDLHIDGLVRAFDARHEADGFRSQVGLGPVKVLGIQPAIFRGKTREHSEQLNWLQNKFGEEMVWDPINQSIFWAEASRERIPVFKYAPDSSAAREAIALIDRFEKTAKAI